MHFVCLSNLYLCIIPCCIFIVPHVASETENKLVNLHDQRIRKRAISSYLVYEYNRVEYICVPVTIYRTS